MYVYRREMRISTLIPLRYESYMVDVIKDGNRYDIAKMLYELLSKSNGAIYAVYVTETQIKKGEHNCFSINIETREAETMQIRVAEVPLEPFTRPLGKKPNFWERLKKAYKYVVKGE